MSVVILSMNVALKIGSSVIEVINYTTSKEMVTLITYKTVGHIRNIESNIVPLRN